MSIFDRLTRATRPLSSADTGAVLAERQAHAAEAATAAEAAHDIYRAALNDGALSGVALDTPAIERAAREHERAQQRTQRANEATAAAQAQHDAALAREAAAARKAEWDAREAIAVRHAAAAAAVSAKAGELAEASNTFAEVHRELYGVLPVSVRSQPTNAIFAKPPFAMVHDELERVEAWPDPRNGSGIPKPKPLAAISADMHVMLKQMRADAGA